MRLQSLGRFGGAAVLMLSGLGGLMLRGAQAAGTLELSVIDADRGEPVPARVRVRDAEGKDHAPAGAVVVPISKDRWFVTAGNERIELTAGEATIRVERGTEYVPLKATVAVKDGEVTHYKAHLKRWIDMRGHGYSSGENHLHIKPGEAAAMLAAEDLSFGTILSWWNGPREKLPDGWTWLTDLSFGRVVVPTAVFDAELEHSWGAAYLVGPQEPLSLKSDKGRANLPYIQEARKHGAMICYQGGWSREVLIDALLGCVDVVNVCNNNFHRHKYQPRKRYSNLLNVEGFPDYPDTPEDMIRMNTETYYRLLNCGLRLAAGAGSATGAKDTPVGYNRAYVRAGEKPTLPAFLQAWREGRNFVTNGPMLFLTVTGAAAGEAAHQPGDTIALSKSGESLTIEVEALSEQPLREVQVIVNGEIVERMRVGPDRRGAELTVVRKFSQPAWIAACCIEEDRLLTDEELAPYRIDVQTSQQPCRLRFAHTSPVHVTVAGQGPRVMKSVQEAAKMIDAFERFAREAAGESHREEILQAVAQARQKLNP